MDESFQHPVLAGGGPVVRDDSYGSFMENDASLLTDWRGRLWSPPARRACQTAKTSGREQILPWSAAVTAADAQGNHTSAQQGCDVGTVMWVPAAAMRLWGRSSVIRASNRGRHDD